MNIQEKICVISSAIENQIKVIDCFKATTGCNKTCDMATTDLKKLSDKMMKLIEEATE